MDYAVIVAGGSGVRMGGDVPKQFLELQGRPILMHTIDRFKAALPDVQVVLVLPQVHISTWNSLCEKYHFSVPHQVVAGGSSRFHSVRNGLAAIPSSVSEAIVGVHDGVRPFVSVEVIRQSYTTAREVGTAVPVIQPVETVRYLPDDTQATILIDRSRCYLVQTPQTFRLSVLRKAYELPYRDSFTDDASVVEASGVPVRLVQGNRENIKITSPFDLFLAQTLIAHV